MREPKGGERAEALRESSLRLAALVRSPPVLRRTDSRTPRATLRVPFEVMILAPLPPRSSRTLGVLLGWDVELHGLQRAEYNGARGVIESIDQVRGRVGVKVTGSETAINIKPSNMLHVPTDGVKDDPELGGRTARRAGRSTVG